MSENATLDNFKKALHKQYLRLGVLLNIPMAKKGSNISLPN